MLPVFNMQDDDYRKKHRCDSVPLPKAPFRSNIKKKYGTNKNLNQFDKIRDVHLNSPPRYKLENPCIFHSWFESQKLHVRSNKSEINPLDRFSRFKKNTSGL